MSDTTLVVALLVAFVGLVYVFINRTKKKDAEESVSADNSSGCRGDKPTNVAEK